MTYQANEKTCHIIGAGDFDPSSFPKKNDRDIVIAADGGFLSLYKIGIIPDIVIGDFDSLPEIDLNHIPNEIKLIRLKKEKDDTDMFSAIKTGIDYGCTFFRLYGGTGGRLDHTLANIQSLAYLAELGLRGILIDKCYTVTAIKNTAIEYSASYQGILSVFAHGDTAYGVYETGLKYGLRDATLKNSWPLGVSNEFIGQKSRISVENGILILIHQFRQP